MPYYQYEISTEVNLATSQHALEAIEKEEENQFNSVLAKSKNRIIDLLDLFFPPRFKKKYKRYKLSPTLPVKHRKIALEFLQARIKSHQIKTAFSCDVANIPGLKDFTAEHIEPIICEGFRHFKSYAFVEYDNYDIALVDEKTILGSFVDTVAFVELLIECDILPFELLNFKIILDLYLKWNEKRLDRLPEELKDKEGWPLIDAVSRAAGFYVLKSWVAGGGWINGFSAGLSILRQPLRWNQEIHENIIGSNNFKRPKGRIDNGLLPEVIINLQNHWNEVFENASQAMKFGYINHTGGKNENVNRIDTHVREKVFFLWAKERGYQYPNFLSRNNNSTSKKLPNQKQKNPASELGKLGSKKSNERHHKAEKLALKIATPLWKKFPHKTKDDMASLVLAEFQEQKVLNGDEPYAASTVMDWIKETQPANKKRGGRPKKKN